MRSFEILPSEKNLISALKEDLLKRNQEIAQFYNLLLSLEHTSTIAIDGRWGSGKTFFVKQSRLVINAKNPMSNYDDEKRDNIISKLPFFKDDESENCDLAVYYDAWKNDNDTDPVMSIIYEIVKQLSLAYDFRADTDVFKVAGAVIEAICGRNVNGIIDNLKCENPLARFSEQKELDNEVKDFFTDILEERGNKLIIFIDELDRCNPRFTIQLLERIKHYFFDDRVLFVFSVNIEELQHTIKHYYGDDFDACRYLDRFFDLTITLPPADKGLLFDKIGLNGSYTLEKVSQRIINVYNMEIREITRYYRHIRTAVYSPTHDNNKWDFSFYEGKAREFMLMCIVPLVVGLRMINISMYDQFINGKNGQPMIDVFNTEEFIDGFFKRMLNPNESFKQEEDKKLVTPENIILNTYNLIFANDYAEKHSEKIGEYRFDKSSKGFVINAASLLSQYVDYEI